MIQKLPKRNGIGTSVRTVSIESINARCLIVVWGGAKVK